MESLVNPSPAFWAGKRVLLTGHTGFKGSWLALWLQHMGARVLGYSLPAPTQPSLFETAQVADGMESIIADIRDLPRLRRAFDELSPEVVFHLAAQSLVRASYKDPVETYSTNVLGTVHVLEAVRQTDSVRSAVIVTTDKCYENREWPWPYREIDSLGGRDPYSSSKACAELVTAAYRSSFLGERTLGVASVRAGNVIGGGDWSEDRLIPDCIRAFRRGDEVSIRNPAAVRPWQHVLEPLAGYLILAERLHQSPVGFGTAFNFGPGAEANQPVSSVVAALAGMWGNGAGWEQDRGSQPHESQMLALDSTKACRTLEWRPRLSLMQSLAWVVDWCRATEEGKSARSVTLAQIERYLTLG